MTLNEIREDLKDIRYYYSRKHLFDSVVSEIGYNSIQLKLQKYNEAVREAPPKLFDCTSTTTRRNPFRLNCTTRRNTFRCSTKNC